jgi:hypothetical protein
MHNNTNDSVTIENESLPFQQIPNWVFESEISPNAVKLYLVLRKNGDNKRGTSYWSRKKLAEQMGCSANTMDRAKKELLDIGAVCQINRKNEHGDWTSNMYHIHVQTTANCRYLLAKVGRPIPTDGQTPIPTNGEQTNNHIELRTKELITRTYGDEVITMSNLFADLIQNNGINRPTVTDRWHQDIERLNRIDGYSWEQIEATIRWVQNDSFWQSNVLSPSKLRKQFGALQLKMKSAGGLSGWARVIAKFDNEQKELGE